jgi:hypothetical protein
MQVGEALARVVKLYYYVELVGSVLRGVEGLGAGVAVAD